MATRVGISAPFVCYMSQEKLYEADLMGSFNQWKYTNRAGELYSPVRCYSFYVPFRSQDEG
jgi:hypothetical protein